jgi:hypothetical protein
MREIHIATALIAIIRWSQSSVRLAGYLKTQHTLYPLEIEGVSTTRREIGNQLTICRQVVQQRMKQRSSSADVHQVSRSFPSVNCASTHSIRESSDEIEDRERYIRISMYMEVLSLSHRPTSVTCTALASSNETYPYTPSQPPPHDRSGENEASQHDLVRLPPSLGVRPLLICLLHLFPFRSHLASLLA